MSATLLPSGALHTEGARIVAADGTAVRLAGVNWYGMEGDWMVPGGLDLRSVDEICELIVALGFNHIRLPLSDTAVLRNPRVSAGLAAMPRLVDARVLDVLDAVVDSARRQRLRVVLDSHRSEPGWSAQGNGLWYSRAVSRRAWRRALVALAQRYAGNDTVIGFDLRNEPGSPPTDATEWPQNGGAVWGQPDLRVSLHPRDWTTAAETAGNAVLGVNSDVLVIVEGVRADPAGPQFDGSNHLYWPGGNLSGVDRPGGRRRQGRPLQLDVPARLVYSAHDYGPDMDHAMPWCQPGTTALTPDACRSVWDQTWGYIAREEMAPLYVGEFGTPNGLWPPGGAARRDYGDAVTSDPQTRWLRYLTDYIDVIGASWAYWPLNGTNSPGGSRDPGQLEGYGLLTRAWDAASNESLLALLGKVQGPPRYAQGHDQ